MSDDSNFKMPAIFIGHGSPLNAVADNDFTQTLNRLGQSLPRPKSILSISAHWITNGTKITSHASPKTIHDFFGFNRELYEILYPAPGNPQLAFRIAEKISSQLTFVGLSHEWGLDHGTWIPLRHMYPEANIPVIQLSLNLNESPSFHFQLGKLLRELRNEGVLIIGSGNIVHNIPMMNWNDDSSALPWAQEFDQWVVDQISQRKYSSLLNDFMKHTHSQLSVPTMEHFLPLLHILGASSEDDQMTIEYQKIKNATISMTTISFK